MSESNKKVKCSISVELNKGLFLAVAALQDFELSDEKVDAIINGSEHELTLSDLGLSQEQVKAFELSLAAIILAKWLEKEEEE